MTRPARIAVMEEEPCAFCHTDWLRGAELVIEAGGCIYSSVRDPADRSEVLPGCGVIVPVAHRTSPFDLTNEEWTATHELLRRVREALDERLAPDGYLLGWNDFPRRGQRPLHAHLHVIPRFDDEPMSDQGVRSAIKVPENVRPFPGRPGNGRAMDR
jgi:histidine triad (HIT) family protein